MTAAKIQHYVPKFLLRNFGTGKKDQLWVFDKASGRSFQTNAKNVASESRFYDFVVDGADHSLEDGLSRIESQAKPIMERILHDDSVGAIPAQGRALLAAFLAIQFVRTRAFRMQWEDMRRLLREKIESMGDHVVPGSQAEALIRPQTENEIKIDTARMILQAPTDLGPHFLSKVWFLAKTTKTHPFMIGDNPIALQNHIDMGPYGNLGLGVKGIEIYFPLSSTRALAMWCPSVAQQVAEAANTLRSLPIQLTASVVRDREGIIALDDALTLGTALPYKPEHVTNFNSLQVSRSERYVFCSMGDFSLPIRMVADHPFLRVGPRITNIASKRTSAE
ncbi:DUF4238 domain-containing protein [Stenotrophomonas sepilia]|uniref:DUF4238 domain-containing protein n=1 Tax=Stenotrophomonas maltophilia group TaxID=995085 RepID=UPI00106FB4FD|nr:DUF4238 domain-containing protein [Stenotrophomonas maltophilia]HDS1549228.1 DUF4238 domain-containing protein [Stenotrophomonas maltophilia]